MQKYDAQEIIRQTINLMIDDVSRKLSALYRGGAQVVPNIPAGDPQTSPYLHSPLAEYIDLLCRAANGEFNIGYSKNDQPRAQLIDALSNVFEVLFPMKPHDRVRQIPVDFHFTRLGQLCIRCQLLINGEEDAITISQAARILYGDSSPAAQARIARMIERREISAWIDPDEPNPQRARRISRTELSLVAISLKNSSKQTHAATDSSDGDE